MNKDTSSQPSLWPLVSGIPLLLLALFFQTVTVAGSNYAPVLLAAILLTALADACFVYGFLYGGRAARVLCVLCLLPTLFVVADFLRRASAVFSH